MKSQVLHFLFLIFAISSCNNNDDNFVQLTNSNEIRVNDNLYSAAPNDDFEIIQANVVNDNLNVTILYGGGCGNVIYDLIAPSDFIGSNPLEKNMRLAFSDKDNCEALIELELSFSIEQIQVTESDQIIINLERWENQIEYNY